MGMFGSKAPQVPLSMAAASYQPSGMDVFLQTLFGHGSPADAADHLRDLHYQQAMRPIQAQAFQDWMGQFGPQGATPAQPTAPAADQDQQPPAPTDLQGMMSNGIGQAIGTIPTRTPVVPQVQQAAAAPARSASPFDLTDPSVQRRIVGGQMFGMPGAEAAFKMGQELMPKGVVVNGRLLNEHDPSAYNHFYGDAPVKGAEPVYDQNGREVGWHMADGSIQAIGQAKEAETLGATRGGLIDAPTGNGGTRKMLGGQYIDATTAPVGGRPSGYAVPQIGGAPGGMSPQGGGGDLGYTPSPAEQELAKGRVGTQVEREKLQPQQVSALDDVRRTSGLTTQIIHQILGDVQDPNTGQWKPGGKPQANWWTTGGPGHVLSHVPGSEAYDLDQQLEHIRAMTSMEELQKLRDNSPTGAGLGRVTQQEINLLASMRGSIDQGQSDPQFQHNLRRQLQQLEMIQNTREKLYRDQYSDIHPNGQQPQARSSAPAASFDRAALLAEARRRGLIH